MKTRSSNKKGDSVKSKRETGVPTRRSNRLKAAQALGKNNDVATLSPHSFQGVPITFRAQMQPRYTTPLNGPDPAASSHIRWAPRRRNLRRAHRLLNEGSLSPLSSGMLQIPRQPCFQVGPISTPTTGAITGLQSPYHSPPGSSRRRTERRNIPVPTVYRYKTRSNRLTRNEEILDPETGRIRNSPRRFRLPPPETGLSFFWKLGREGTPVISEDGSPIGVVLPNIADGMDED